MSRRSVIVLSTGQFALRSSQHLALSVPDDATEQEIRELVESGPEGLLVVSVGEITRADSVDVHKVVFDEPADDLPVTKIKRGPDGELIVA